MIVYKWNIYIIYIKGHSLRTKEQQQKKKTRETTIKKHVTGFSCEIVDRNGRKKYQIWNVIELGVN